MGNSKKVMLIGWDAADWKIINKLIDEGKMPTVASMVDNGVAGNMRTLFPSLSPMLWTTIATGKRPYKHGIYGFMEPTADGKSVQAISNISRNCKALWNILTQKNMASMVVGWWPSHPAEPINGCMVSDFYHKVPKKPDAPWKLMPAAIHPPNLFDELEKVRLHPAHLNENDILAFVPNAREIDQKVDGRLSQVMRTFCECTTIHGAATHLLETQEWDLAAIYYDAIDHFCHGFMRYHPPRLSHVSEKDFRFYSDVVTMGYQYHDMMLARLMELGGDDTTYILMSDHGFHPDHLRAKLIPTEPAGPAVEHRDFGIFIAQGPGIKKDEIVHGVGLMDVTPTILSLFDLPVGEDMDGRVLTEIFSDKREIATIDSWENVSGEDGRHPKNFCFDPKESKEALEQLIALGYIERPDDDNEVAVKQCVSELNYNLARSYMDAGRHGDAIPLLTDLYNDNPLEFRFGIQLSNCLKAMDRIPDLELLVGDLNERWRVASDCAKSRLTDIAKIARERKKQWRKFKEIDKQNEEKGIDHAARLAQTNPNGRPKLFSDAEYYDIRKIRSVARGNPQTLDFLNATIATSKGDFERALEYLELAEVSKSNNPAFHYQLGNVYFGLQRHDDAERTFAKSLEIDEYYPEAILGLCRVCLANSQYRKAADYGRQAVGLKYHFPVGHYFLGQALYQDNDVQGAINCYQKAIQQNPNFVEAHTALSDIYKTKEIDTQLAKEHETIAADLTAGNKDYDQEVVELQIQQSGSVDYSAILPTIKSNEETENPDFDPCLGQISVVGLDDQDQRCNKDDIVVVTGLPRSGTSMMMQMLVAGGLTAHSDDRRQADDNNPKGYFESEEVKKIAQSNYWLKDCGGKVIKIVAPLIPYLAKRHSYRVIMMNRSIDEILASQEKMLERLDRVGGDLTKEKFQNVFERQIQFCKQLFQLYEIPYFVVDYPQVVSNPEETSKQLVEFLKIDMNIHNMTAAVEPALYREKSKND